MFRRGRGGRRRGSYGPKYSRGRRGRRGGRGGRTFNKAAPYKAGGAGKNSKITVSNLDHGLTEIDVKEIFQKVGRVSNAIINHDSAGRSRGTAEVSFVRAADAQKAIAEYDRAEVDGRPMYLKLVGGATAKTVTVVQKGNAFRNPSRNVRVRGRSRSLYGSRGRRGASRFRSRGRGRRGGRGGRGTRRSSQFRSRGRGRRGRGRCRGRRRTTPSKTVEQLDKEMELYHSKAGGDQTAAGQPKRSTAFTGQPPALGDDGQDD